MFQTSLMDFQSFDLIYAAKTIVIQKQHTLSSWGGEITLSEDDTERGTELRLVII